MMFTGLTAQVTCPRCTTGFRFQHANTLLRQRMRVKLTASFGLIRPIANPSPRIPSTSPCGGEQTCLYLGTTSNREPVLAEPEVTL